MPNFFLLGIFVLSFRRTRLALAPHADSSALALRAVSTASVQYFWVSRLDVESSEKLISEGIGWLQEHPLEQDPREH